VAGRELGGGVGVDDVIEENNRGWMVVVDGFTWA
jgi:hypothetical protein